MIPNQWMFYLVVAFIIIFIFLYRKQVKKTRELFMKLALKRNGIVKNGGIFASQRLSFKYQDSEVIVYIRPGYKNSPPHTTVEVDLRVFRESEIFPISSTLALA